MCCAQSIDLHNPWNALRKAWIHALCGQSMDCTTFAQSQDCTSCMCVGSLFMSRGVYELTTKDSSIMVDQVAFDDFIIHNFVEKRKNWSKLITRTKGVEITAYQRGLKSVEDAHIKFWVKSRGFTLMDYPMLGLRYGNQTVVRLIRG